MSTELEQLKIHSTALSKALDEAKQKIVLLEAWQTTMNIEFQKMKERMHELEHREIGNVTEITINTGGQSKQPPSLPGLLDLR